MSLSDHFREMQGMCSRFLQPEPYTDREGVVWSAAAPEGFLGDIIWMLDGPEQRAAQGIEAGTDEMPLPLRCCKALDDIRSLLKHARTDAVDLVESIHAITRDALSPPSNNRRSE